MFNIYFQFLNRFYYIFSSFIYISLPYCFRIIISIINQTYSTHGVMLTSICMCSIYFNIMYKKILSIKDSARAWARMSITGTRDQIANIQRIIKKARGFQKNIYFCFIDYAKAFDWVDHNKLWQILKEMGIPDHLTCLLRNLFAGQAATVRTGRGTTD